ncbi:MAG: hypothetical protein ACYCWB_16210 [Thiobacillus sp.]
MPLRESANPDAGIDHMFEAVIHFFHSARRVCLVGTFALDETRDRYASEVYSYFTEWVRVLVAALKCNGFDANAATRETTEDVVVGIQRALVLVRAPNDSGVFLRVMKRSQQRTRPMPHN